MTSSMPFTMPSRNRLNLLSLKTTILCLSAIFACVFLCSGCDRLRAQKEAEAGKKALINCDFENAYRHFRIADEYYPNHHEILIGLAFSEFISFFDTPEVRTLLEKLGFQFNVHSVCKKLTARDHDPNVIPKDACHALDFYDIAQSYSRENFLNSYHHDHTDIDPSLMWSDIISTLNDQKVILKSASNHAFAAARLNTPYYRAGRIFDYDIKVHALDLSLLSIAASLLYIVIDIADAYRWDFSVSKTIQAFKSNDYTWLVQALNHEFLRRKNSHPPPESLGEIQQTIAVLGFATPLLAQIIESSLQFDDRGCPVQISVLNWHNLHYGILTDLEKASYILNNDPSTANLDGFFDPVVALNLASLLDNPPSLSSNVAHFDGKHFHWTLDELPSQLNLSFHPPIFDENSNTCTLYDDFSLRLNSAWLKFSLDDLFWHGF